MKLNKTIFNLLLTELKKIHKECVFKNKKFFSNNIYKKLRFYYVLEVISVS